MKSILAIGELGSMTNVYKVYWLHCIDYMVLVTFYLYRLYIFPDFQKKNLKIINNKELIEPLKGLFGVHDGWKRLHQD